MQNGGAEFLMVANGLNMWDTDQDGLSLCNFQDKFKRQCSRQGSNAQLTGRGVKELSYVSIEKRDESARSTFALAQGDTIEEVGIAYRQLKREEKAKKQVRIAMMTWYRCRTKRSCIESCYKQRLKRSKLIIYEKSWRSNLPRTTPRGLGPTDKEECVVQDQAHRQENLYLQGSFPPPSCSKRYGDKAWVSHHPPN